MSTEFDAWTKFRDKKITQFMKNVRAGVQEILEEQGFDLDSDECAALDTRVNEMIAFWTRVAIKELP